MMSMHNSDPIPHPLNNTDSINEIDYTDVDIIDTSGNSLSLPPSVSLSLVPYLAQLKSIIEHHNKLLLQAYNDKMNIIHSLTQENNQLKAIAATNEQASLLVSRSPDSSQLKYFHGESLNELTEEQLNSLSTQLQATSAKVSAQLHQRSLCAICYAEVRSMTFLPCSHTVCCELCAQRVNQCITCRQEIKQTIPKI
jgi:hypothetical protein